MRQKPNLIDDTLIACLRSQYDLDIVSVRYLPVGYDLNAFVYEAMASDETSYFVKVRIGDINPASLLVPRVLIEHNIPNILAPLRTGTQALWCPLEEYSVIVYPLIRGENAMKAGMTDSQWREFGQTLHAIHSGGFAKLLEGQIPVETFSLPSAALVRQVALLVHETHYASQAAAQLATFWTDHVSLIEHLLLRAEELGKQLQAEQFESVLCHADIHAANILVSEDGRIFLVDWDGPLLAPRERDLLFIIGSQIARRVQPCEEVQFFEGYGAVNVNMTALTYYRYERIIEDIGSFGKSVFLDVDLSEEVKAEEAQMLQSLFDPDQIIDATLQADHNQRGTSLSKRYPDLRIPPPLRQEVLDRIKRQFPESAHAEAARILLGYRGPFGPMQILDAATGDLDDLSRLVEVGNNYGQWVMNYLYPGDLRRAQPLIVSTGHCLLQQAVNV